MKNNNKVLKDYTLFESKVKNVLLEYMVEHLDISLNESVDIASKIMDILERYGFDSPDDSIIRAIGLTDDAGSLSYTEVGKDGDLKRPGTTKKIGTLLKKIFPDMDIVGDQRVQEMINEIKQLSTGEFNFEVKLSNNVLDGYLNTYKSGIPSCVTGEEGEKIKSGLTAEMLATMDADENIKIALMYDKRGNGPIGRALVWMNVEGLDAPFVDRTYPSKDSAIHSKFVQWAIKEGYYYRDGMGYQDEQIISGEQRKIYYNFGKTPKEMGMLPYMDTLKYGSIADDGTFVVGNHSSDFSEYVVVINASNGTNINSYKSLAKQRIEEHARYGNYTRPLYQNPDNCGYCNDELGDTRVHLLYGFDICRECSEEYCTICEECQKILNSQDTVRITDEDIYICGVSYQEFHHTQCFEPTKYFRCESCSNINKINQKHAVYTNSYVCDECFKDYCSCDLCSLNVLINSVKKLDYLPDKYKNMNICSYCYRAWMKCSICSKKFPRDQLNDQDGVLFCTDCSTKNVVRCSGCDDKFEKDVGGQYLKNLKKYYCKDCIKITKDNHKRTVVWDYCDKCHEYYFTNELYKNNKVLNMLVGTNWDLPEYRNMIEQEQYHYLCGKCVNEVLDHIRKDYNEKHPE